MYTQNAGLPGLPGLQNVIFSGCSELFILDDRVRGRKPPQIRYEYEIESGTIYPTNPTDDPTAEEPIIKPTIEKPLIFRDYSQIETQDIQTLDSLYDCDSFHDCAGVLG